MLADRVRMGSRKGKVYGVYRMSFEDASYMYDYSSYISYRYDGGPWIDVREFGSISKPIHCEEVQFKVSFIDLPRKLFCYVKINGDMFFQAESSIGNTFISKVYKLYEPITVDMEIY